MRDVRYGFLLDLTRGVRARGFFRRSGSDEQAEIARGKGAKSGNRTLGGLVIGDARSVQARSLAEFPLALKRLRTFSTPRYLGSYRSFLPTKEMRQVRWRQLCAEPENA